MCVYRHVDVYRHDGSSCVEVDVYVMMVFHVYRCLCVTMKQKGNVMERKVRLKSVNPHIICCLCKGYMINATTITECLHTCKLYIIIDMWIVDYCRLRPILALLYRASVDTAGISYLCALAMIFAIPAPILPTSYDGVMKNKGSLLTLHIGPKIKVMPLCL